MGAIFGHSHRPISDAAEKILCRCPDFPAGTSSAYSSAGKAICIRGFFPVFHALARINAICACLCGRGGYGTAFRQMQNEIFRKRVAGAKRDSREKMVPQDCEGPRDVAAELESGSSH